MPRPVRVLLAALLVLAGLALLGAGGLWIASERIIHRTYEVPLTAVSVPADSASVAEGRRLALTRGCPACHGDNFAGEVFFDEPGTARLVAPNLTAVVPTYSDAELARLLRHGIRLSGESAFGMPTRMLHELSDADVGRLVAYLRTLAPRPGLDHALEVGPRGRLGVVIGMFSPTATEVDPTDPPTPHPPPADTLALGRYLARSACTECHGPTLMGDDTGSPALTVVAAYPDSAFARLMRTGKTVDGRDPEMMGPTARSRFVHLTDAEVTALHAYLRTLATPR